MGRTRMGRTDGLTDGQGGDYMLHRNFSGSIITDMINIFNTVLKPATTTNQNQPT